MPLLLDEEMAAVVEAFREPSSIPQALIRLSEKRHCDPRELLKETFQFLQRLVGQRFLVDADRVEDSQTRTPMLGPGDWLEDFEIVRSMQRLEDMEVYQVRLADGRFAALKIQGHESQSAAERLHHEAEILQFLNGTAAPELLCEGVVEGRDFLLLEWARGSDALIAAEEWRLRGTTEARCRLLEIAVRILETYAGLHARGVLHGDVNPHNLLTDRDQGITLIDFEDAMWNGPGAEISPPRYRGGVSIYFEPEYARAALAGEPLPPATEAGEQYALAALLYELIAGLPYLDFDLRWKVLLGQIVDEEPKTFAERGLPPWSGVEGVLSRSMSKEPEARYPSMAAMAEALAGAEPAEPTQRGKTSPTDTRLDELIERITDKAAVGGPWMETGVNSLGSASVYEGAAGVALALYRMSRQLERTDLLDLACNWIGRATEALAGDMGRDDLADRETSSQIAGASPFVGAAGVHLVEAAVSEASQQMDRRSQALERGLQGARQKVGGIDLYDGLSSRLLTLGFLVEQCDRCESIDRQAVLDLGEATLNALWTDLDRRPRIADTLGDLGMAHGWAGCLHASLRWCEASRTLAPPKMEVRSRELAGQSVPIGRGLMWPWRLPLADTREPRFTAGWCNGSAGYVYLWIMAARALDDDSFLELAEGAAWNAWESAQRDGTLCCALVGRAYALLALFQASGETVWLDRARDLGSLAVREGEFEPHGREGLFQGELGLALLAADLRHPEQAWFPWLTALPG